MLRDSRIVASGYRLLPASFRSAVRSRAWRELERQVAFPALPPALGHASVDAARSPKPRGPRAGAVAVNVFGFLGGQFGLGESARLYASALQANGVPVTLHDLKLELPHAWQADPEDAFRTGPDEDGVDLIVVNPDDLGRALPLIAAAGGSRRHRIGLWFWELETMPASWAWATEAVDEIMVASAFIEEAARKMTSKPVTRIPIPLAARPDSGLERRDFGLPVDAFMFLATFDFHSSIQRKNPFAAIRAFQQAFPPGRGDVCLLVKTVNGLQYPELLSQLTALSHLDDRILVRDGTIPSAHLGALQRTCDAYVSLHRAEGFGLGMAECMARGKPVVATGWSGNLEFMTPETSCLVDYRLVAVNAHEYPYADAATARWAEPDIDDAAACMRRLVDEPGHADRIGRSGASHVRQVLSPARISAAFAAHVAESASGLRPDPGLPEKCRGTAASPCRQ
jgi:glycosyltransferase involved in cell wall biosynthesis